MKMKMEMTDGDDDGGEETKLAGARTQVRAGGKQTKRKALDLQRTIYIYPCIRSRPSGQWEWPRLKHLPLQLVLPANPDASGRSRSEATRNRHVHGDWLRMIPHDGVVKRLLRHLHVHERRDLLLLGNLE
jgi:hypothetical protein